MLEHVLQTMQITEQLISIDKALCPSRRRPPQEDSGAEVITITTPTLVV